MMRVNLLGGTAEHRVAVQKTKVAARRGQQIFMLASALVIFVLAIGIDHLWTNNAHASAQAELTREEEEARKLEADIKRKEELEAELKQVDERIKVIAELGIAATDMRQIRIGVVDDFCFRRPHIVGIDAVPRELDLRIPVRRQPADRENGIVGSSAVSRQQSDAHDRIGDHFSGGILSCSFRPLRFRGEGG